MEESRVKRANQLQATGDRVTVNLAAIRKDRRLTTAALSERLTVLGRPILANGITKIEKGARRVDTDDLIALAIALDVTPNALLLPPAADDERVSLTPSLWITAKAAWRWAVGEEPLPADAVHDTSRTPLRQQRFHRENRPHEDELTQPELSGQVAELNRQLVEQRRHNERLEQQVAAITEWLAAGDVANRVANIVMMRIQEQEVTNDGGEPDQA